MAVTLDSLRKESAMSARQVPYLRSRRGRYFVRVRVPKDLQGRFKDPQERYLGTSDPREARRKAPIVVAEIMARFERARLGRLTPAEIKDAAHAELQRTHAFLSSDPFTGPDAVADYLFLIQQGDRESLDYEALEPKARAVIKRIGAETSAESVRAVSDAIAEAAFTAQELWQKNIQPPQRPVSIRPPVSKGGSNVEGGMLLSEVLEAWVFEHKPTARTEQEWRHAVRRWKELHGDSRIRTITREQVSEYKDALLRAPAQPPHKIRELPLPRMIEAAKARGGYRTKGATTVNKMIGAIRSILNWAVDNGRLDNNPASRVRAPKPKKKSNEKRRPFTVPELRKVLKAAAKEKRQADRWLPFLAAFMGARESEIALATTTDVREENGIAYLQITDVGEGRSIKNESSLRNVPVHPTLIKLGFLEYVRKRPKGAPLFPDLTNAAAYSKRFGRLLDDIGLDDPALVFHSFRHGFKDACRNAGLSEETHDALTGHAGDNRNVGRSYGTGYSLEALAAAVRKIEYKGLNLTGVKL